MEMTCRPATPDCTPIHTDEYLSAPSTCCHGCSCHPSIHRMSSPRLSNAQYGPPRLCVSITSSSSFLVHRVGCHWRWWLYWYLPGSVLQARYIQYIQMRCPCRPRQESSFSIRLRLVFKSMQIGTIQAPLRCSFASWVLSFYRLLLFQWLVLQSTFCTCCTVQTEPGFQTWQSSRAFAWLRNFTLGDPVQWKIDFIPDSELIFLNPPATLDFLLLYSCGDPVRRHCVEVCLFGGGGSARLVPYYYLTKTTTIDNRPPPQLQNVILHIFQSMLFKLLC